MSTKPSRRMASLWTLPMKPAPNTAVLSLFITVMIPFDARSDEIQLYRNRRRAEKMALAGRNRCRIHPKTAQQQVFREVLGRQKTDQVAVVNDQRAGVSGSHGRKRFREI